MPSSTQNARFGTRFVDALRADPLEGGRPRQVRGAHYSRVLPTRVKQPTRIAFSSDLAEELALPGDPDWTAVLAGQKLLPGMAPYAMCYGGHQFGHWAGQLGDGRAINLGEWIDIHGQSQTLQLKGAGPTPYSRSGDGWAVLRSSVREFLCSEAMFHLGVPTTRALSLVLTGDKVLRDMFYDGRANYELGAVVCRVAPSFVRFGNFELLAAREENEALRELADFVIRENFPKLVEGLAAGAELTPDIYLAWFRAICQSTAEMIVHWSRVGFVHGVLNTDNLSILGLTIDYGPYGWVENYDPGWTPNTTDGTGKRYAFGEQSRIGLWNLLKLANSILPLIQDVEALQEALGHYTHVYDRGWEAMMAHKLGLQEWREDPDEALTRDLLALFEQTETDWTLFFRALPDLQMFDGSDPKALRQWMTPLLYLPGAVGLEYWDALAAWAQRMQSRWALEGSASEDRPQERREAMDQVNPKYVLRNYLAQLAIEDAEKGEYAKLKELQRVLRRPYDEQPSAAHLAQKRPEWARTKPGCSMLSCSS